MKWTREKIEALPLGKRESLFDNARAQTTPEAQRIIELMVEHDLLVRSGGGLPRHHPTIRTIEEIVRSDAGRAGGIEASGKGLPALAGVDHMLSAALGPKYGDHDTTSWAGTLMAEAMAEAGFVTIGRKSMPEGCVARTAATFGRR